MSENPLEDRVFELEKRSAEFAHLFRALGKFSEKERDILLKAITEEEHLRASIESLKVLEVRVAKLEKLSKTRPTPQVNRDILDRMEVLQERLHAFEKGLEQKGDTKDVQVAFSRQVEDLQTSLDKMMGRRLKDLAERINAVEKAQVDTGPIPTERLDKLEDLVDSLVEIIQRRRPSAVAGEAKATSPRADKDDWKGDLLSAHDQLAKALGSFKTEKAPQQ